jgi:mannose-binding lectin 2
MEFRISGQGKKFFGDGMALWFMQQAYYVEGEFHGSVERFTGFGVILDTFKNTETLAYHKDVSLVFNDGTQTVETMMENKVGCDANIRYHEDRGDFSVTSSSRIKVVVVEGTQATVSVDAKNDGNFMECASLTLPFASDWAEKAHIGVTASTGQLADNHDVLSIVSFSDIARHETFLEQTDAAPAFERGLGFNKERFERLEDKVSELQEKLDFLHHKMEHELASIEDHIKVTTSKLSAQEAISEGRIDEIEKSIKSSITNDVQGSINMLSNNMDEQLLDRIKNVEGVLHEKITESMDGAVANMGGWKLPFFFLLIIMIIGAFSLYKWYEKLKKTHML